MELERYGTMQGWTKELDLSWSSIAARLKESEGVIGRDTAKRLQVFFAESAVRNACADLLADVPQADNDGFFVLNSVRYGSATGWAQELGLGRTTIRRRLSSYTSHKGKDMRGAVRDGFWREQDVREACADLVASTESSVEQGEAQSPLTEEHTGAETPATPHRRTDMTALTTMLPQADDEGFLLVNSERHATLSTWAEQLDAKSDTIKLLISDVEGVEGLCGNRRHLFFAESAVMERCKGFEKDIPRAGDDGMFTLHGIRYGTLGAWSRTFGIGQRAITKTMEGRTGITGRDGLNRLQENAFHDETTVRAACALLLAELPVAGDDGFLILDEGRAGTIGAWEKDLGIHNSILRQRLMGAPSVEGRDKGNRIFQYYAEAVVRLRCTDSLRSLPVAGDDGFLVQDEGRAGTIGLWEKHLGIHNSILRKRLEGAPFQEGRDKGGRVWRYYPETVVRERCSDLLRSGQTE